MASPSSSPPASVSLVTLGCARNEVDSSELAGALQAAGWSVVDDPGNADVVLVNTCGFIEAAKKDSIDALLEASDLKATGRTRAVVAVGCLAERYGVQLAGELPEADAVLGFDQYPQLATRLDEVLAGRRPASHVPRDRRVLLPLAPTERPRTRVDEPDLPARATPASGPRPVRRVLGAGPVAALKIASGCDRRCAFCAIPSFRGAFRSRPPEEVVAEARWLAEQGVTELVLVSENSTSYGKDRGDPRALEVLLPRLAAVDGVRRVRVSYLQPAEVRPGLVEVICTTPGVAPYFDLSFQHASPAVLRRMRRFGSTDRFLELIDSVRVGAPQAGVRTNVIVGFPGETEADLAELEGFLVAARMDAVGVFGYSDEEGTEAAGLAGHLDPREVADRVARVTRLVEELTAQRAEDRVGEQIEILVERGEPEPADGYLWQGRGAHQGPEVDGSTEVRRPGTSASTAPVGQLVRARVVGSRGVDLQAVPADADGWVSDLRIVRG
ncbi:MAG: 30S ribosomal protein S12 methylthiotransferase RimO [Actinomycetes bacterium]